MYSPSRALAGGQRSSFFSAPKRSAILLKKLAAMSGLCQRPPIFFFDVTRYDPSPETSPPLFDLLDFRAQTPPSRSNLAVRKLHALNTRIGQ